MQRILIVLVVGLMAVGCLTPEQKQKTLRDSVVGEYEFKLDGTTRKAVLLENGVYELYENGEKQTEHKWSIVDGEIHAAIGSEFIAVFRINADKSITWIAGIRNGKRKDRPKEDQTTFKKIK